MVFLCNRHSQISCYSVTQPAQPPSYVKSNFQANFRGKPFKKNVFPKMWFMKFVPRLPMVKAQDEEEEELVDPQVVLREKCRETEHYQHLAEKLQICNDRVNSRSQTAETCSEELFDMMHALDHCVTKDLFSKLK